MSESSSRGATASGGRPRERLRHVRFRRRRGDCFGPRLACRRRGHLSAGVFNRVLAPAAVHGSVIRKRFRCTVVLTYAYVPGSRPGTMPSRSTTWVPGMASACAGDWMPAAGKSGRPVCGTTGRATIFPVLVRDLCSISTYRNLPSGDQAEWQTPAQIRRGDPPPVGTAIDALVSPAAGSGVMAMIQRRSGEIFMIVLIGYGTTLERSEPCVFI